MKKSFIILSLIIFVSCAKWSDRIASKGSLIGSVKAPYIIINQSGGKIMDVYKLPNTIVQSSEESDGWLFLDQFDHPVFLGGDVKTIRLKSTSDPLWSQYHEYHIENESISYREKYAK